MKPKTDVHVRLVGTDGNIFALVGKVSQALKRAGYQQEANDMKKEVMEAGSYDEALCVLMSYVEVE